MSLTSMNEALELLNGRVRDDRLKKHMLAVGAIMKGLARRLGEDEDLWIVTGLLHDLDYEETANDFKKHGLVTAESLKDLLPQLALDAIKAHNEETGFTSDSSIATALKVADQLSGLIVATALVMPNKALSEVQLTTLKKKFKQKDFARGVDREKIMLCSRLGIALDDALAIGLEFMKEVRKERVFNEALTFKAKLWSSLT